MQPPKPIYSYLAAAALALVTVFSFYVFQDFGPQSVLRRFHIDVARRDYADINRISTRSLKPEEVQALQQRNGFFRGWGPSGYICSFVLLQIANDASYEILYLKRLHGEVLATVEYRWPNGNEFAVVYHVQQTDRDWRIESDETAKAISDSLSRRNRLPFN